MTDAEILADNILKASGSGLKNYNLSGSREKIIAAAKQGIDDFSADLLKELTYAADALEITATWVRLETKAVGTANGIANDAKRIRDAITKATQQK